MKTQSLTLHELEAKVANLHARLARNEHEFHEMCKSTTPTTPTSHRRARAKIHTLQRIRSELTRTQKQLRAAQKAAR